jgi:hypothetical protein
LLSLYLRYSSTKTSSFDQRDDDGDDDDDDDDDGAFISPTRQPMDKEEGGVKEE